MKEKSLKVYFDWSSKAKKEVLFASRKPLKEVKQICDFPGMRVKRLVENEEVEQHALYKLAVENPEKVFFIGSEKYAGFVDEENRSSHRTIKDDYDKAPVFVLISYFDGDEKTYFEFIFPFTGGEIDFPKLIEEDKKKREQEKIAEGKCRVYREKIKYNEYGKRCVCAPSVRIAKQLLECEVVKDAGFKWYGGELFEKVLGQHPFVPFTFTSVETKEDVCGIVGVFESLDKSLVYRGAYWFRFGQENLVLIEKVEGEVSYAPIEKIGEFEIPKKKSKKFRVVLEYEVVGDTTWTNEKFMKEMEHQMEKEIYGNYDDNKNLGCIVINFSDEE